MEREKDGSESQCLFLCPATGRAGIPVLSLAFMAGRPSFAALSVYVHLEVGNDSPLE